RLLAEGKEEEVGWLEPCYWDDSIRTDRTRRPPCRHCQTRNSGHVLFLDRECLRDGYLICVCEKRVCHSMDDLQLGYYSAELYVTMLS
ncbi:hypothetical protein JMJ77_0001793, partial [Colletotrichum scovillei]